MFDSHLFPLKDKYNCRKMKFIESRIGIAIRDGR
jgi:hypothetical protein